MQVNGRISALFFDFSVKPIATDNGNGRKRKRLKTHGMIIRASGTST
jgi:hypothetical protein